MEDQEKTIYPRIKENKETGHVCDPGSHSIPNGLWGDVPGTVAKT